MPTTGTGFKKLEEKVAAGKPLTFTEQNIVNRASGVPTVKPTTVPVAPPPVAPVTTTPLFKTVNPIQDKLDAAAQERERQQNQAVLSNPSAYSLEAVNKANAWQSGQQPGKTISQQAESQMMGEFKTNFDEALKRGITLPYKTFEEYKAWKQQPIDQATSYTQQQQDLARMSEGLKFEKARTDIEAAKAGNVAALAQGREGVQSAGNVMARSQFAAEMERQKQQMNIERQSAEAQRVKAMADLKRAREEGDVSLATAIQGQISQIESNLRQIDTEAMNAATSAADLALKQAQLGATEKQNATTSLINTFEKMGAGMANLTPDAITAMVQGTNVTAGAALAWQAGEKLKAEAAKTKDEAEASYKLAQAEKLQAEIKNIGKTADVLTYEYYTQLSPEGQNKFKEVLAMDKGSQLVKLDDGSLVIYNPTTSTMQRVPAGSPAISNMQNTDIQNVFTLEGTSKYRTDGGWECGEGANKITEGGKAGDTYASKLALVTKQDSPQIGNQIMLPIGSPNNGHIGTVISYDPTTRNVKTVEWNHNLDGKQTVESYNIDDLNKRYPPKGGKVQWGFSDSTLKPQYEEALNNAAVPSNDIEGMKIRAIVNGLGGTAGERNENMKNMKALIASGKAANAAEAKAQLGLITPADKELQATMKAELQVEQKGFKEILGQLAPAEQLLNTKTGMGDYTAIVGFLKTIDPGSVARESEVESVQNAKGLLSGIFERLQNKTLTGEKLTEQQRSEMKQAIDVIKNARAAKYYENLISRKLETESSGTPATFASKSEIAGLERWLGKEKADEIKNLVSESLGITKPQSTYVIPEDNPHVNNL